MAGTITISSSTITTQTGTKTISLIITAANPIGQVTESNFPGAQSNTITIPTGASAMVIAPPTANVTGLTLKGIAGDTGITISPGGPQVISFPTAAPASFVLTSAGAITGNVEVSFI